MCLQKMYVPDHLTKQLKVNRGDLPKYYVEGSHEGIIDRSTFEAVQAEMARRAEKAKPSSARTCSEFSSIIRCGKCDANFYRKINAAGTKHANCH